MKNTSVHNQGQAFSSPLFAILMTVESVDHDEKSQIVEERKVQSKSFSDFIMRNVNEANVGFD